MGIDLLDQKNFPENLGNQITKLYLKLTNSLNSRLVISHLAVALVSIILMAAFTGRYIFQAANAETEHNLQDLAFAASNAIQLPIIEVREGRSQPQFIKDLLNRIFADAESMRFTVFSPAGTPAGR